MSSDPLVSVIVPAYRASRTLARCIDSVLAQTFTGWELILVEQSGAGTPERAAAVEIVQMTQRRMRNPERLRLIEQENTGASGGRNRGIEESRGAFVAFLDADDEYLSRKLERQLALFRLRPELGLVFGDYAFVDLEGRRHESVFDELAPEARRVPSQEIAPGLRVCGPDLFRHLARQYFIATIVGMVRREVLADDLRFSTAHRYAEEWLFYLEIARRTRAGYVDEPLCLHHHVTGSASRTSRSDNLTNLASLLEEMLQRFADADRETRAEIRRRLAGVRSDLGMFAYARGEHRVAALEWARSLHRRADVRVLARCIQAALLSLRPRVPTAS
ncbi:MAG: glycosyltransferase [Phycisphaerae bacterium]|nr:MAG: glycosyltransferase family 2 protein [Planctomycetota bacterium]KAB2941491.1 MAG: glycosyltransferase [Phycisphaerae bacterium]MBE7455027.1 glycosyltransferase [Planctomycetia bacterium]MCK6464738.1 glycosyltransferase [Phycisphaerae bacterium]MCL4718926.1 glycosyltransferase [Phycisphaerae bacterium]